MKSALLSAAMIAVATPSVSDVLVSFEEAAPKDRFTITNDGACSVRDATVTLDLGDSAAGLIFDVTGAGAGVSVFQPLEIVAGEEFLTDMPIVRDGDTRIAFAISDLAPGARIAFTIDVDDTAGISETMVSGAEILGAKVVVSHQTVQASASFDKRSIARVPFTSCNA